MAPHIHHFLLLLRELQRIDPEFPLQYAVCLAEIAADEGLSLTRLAEKTGMPLSTVSRIAGALSTHRQRGAPFGLVAVEIVPHERRKKQLFLTPHGRTVMGRIEFVLRAPAGQLRA